MTSSVDTRRQHIYNDGKASISAERLDSASIPGSLARLQSNQQSETPVLSDVQMQSTSEIEVKSTEGGGEEVEGQQQEEGQEVLRKIKKDLEDTTGFGSYEDYLESLRRDPMHVGRRYVEIMDAFSHGPDDLGSGVDIIDVSNESPSPAGVSLRCENLPASKISGALCHPPPCTRAQIVLWPIDFVPRDFKDFLDVLGVGLQLESSFFEDLRWRKDEPKHNRYFPPKNSLSIRSLGISVFVARSFVLAQDNPVPVVLIAGPMHQSSPRARRIYDIVQAAPLYNHYRCGERLILNNPAPCKPRFANTYIRALFNLLKSGGDSALSSSDTLSACIIPLLQIEIAICQGDLDYLSRWLLNLKSSFFPEPFIYSPGLFGTSYQGHHEKREDLRLPIGEAPERLYHYRTSLRTWLEYFENQNGALMGLLSPLLGPNVTEGLFYPQIKEESISLAEKARRLEAQIRDHLQLQGSKMAVEESKKSIELSNYQIYESKRVKIFTILAFFYVPLNLATSVFGMNLQQLNGSGRSIGVFLGTSGILLFVTGVSWLLLEGVQDVRVYLRRPEEDRRPVPSQDYGIFIRLYLIWWLSRNGLFKWMIRTGAGWCLLIDSPVGFRRGARFHTHTCKAFGLSNLSWKLCHK